MIISMKIQTLSNKDGAVQTLSSWTGLHIFTGHHLGLCGLSCGLEHMPNTKCAGEVPFCACVLDLRLFRFAGWMGRKAAASRLHASAPGRQRKACYSCGLMLCSVKYQPYTLPPFLHSTSACCHLRPVGTAAAAASPPDKNRRSCGYS